MKYWQAALLGFLGAAIVFMLLPVPGTLAIRSQILVLLGLQLLGIGVGLATIWLRRRRTREQFDLLPALGQRTKDRPKLRVVHSRK
jgi:hypothetical protein